ncbi:uncharacterized protein LOC126892836 [Diabrotica virgifera virgifera]|uniref:Nucleic-acid-binding protein from transposon X-element n=1 Tax=Diabrotica virgifera virgifera TaxID=50390 RepID=A0ABM5L7W7_DIAVI|nr:uncharacterized protein LOC126892836 [Diabrotica virgifera virgifera]
MAPGTDVPGAASNSGDGGGENTSLYDDLPPEIPNLQWYDMTNSLFSSDTFVDQDHFAHVMAHMIKFGDKTYPQTWNQTLEILYKNKNEALVKSFMTRAPVKPAAQKNDNQTAKSNETSETAISQETDSEFVMPKYNTRSTTKKNFPPLPKSKNTSNSNSENATTSSSSSSNTSKPATTNKANTSNQQAKKTYHYKILNIPNNIDTQRKLCAIINTNELLRGNIILLTFIPNQHMAYLETGKNFSVEEMSLKLQNKTGDNSIKIISKFSNNSSSPKNSNPSSTSKTHQYQLVATNIDVEMTEAEMKEALEEQDIQIHSAVRIIARKDQRVTKLMRINFTTEGQYNFALAHGIKIDAQIKRCEAPHSYSLSNPITKYCSRCCLSGHDIAECRDRQSICPSCGSKDHKFTNCPTKDVPKCPNCEGQHAAWSPKCPKRQTPPTSHQDAKPVYPEKRVPPKILTEEAKTFITFSTMLMANVLPDRRNHICKTASELSTLAYGHSISYSDRDNRVHLTFVPQF